LGVESPDPVLSLLAAMGMGQVVGTALVVDLCGDLNLRSERTLADIAADGPALEELSPGRRGVAILGSGPLSPIESAGIIADLAVHWPAVVVRCRAEGWEGPTVPVRPLLPGLMQQINSSPAVWQRLASGVKPSGPGPVLPRIRASTVRRMLAGRAVRGSRWLEAWGPVWGMPWA
jgi:hypothetical protein